MPWPKVKNFYSCNLWIFIMNWSLRIMSREFFRCATRTQPLWSKLAHIYLSLLRKLAIFQFFSDLFPFSTNKKWQQKLLFCPNWNSAITKKLVDLIFFFVLTMKSLDEPSSQNRRNDDDKKTTQRDDLNRRFSLQ